MQRQQLMLRWFFVGLLILEIAALAVALRVVPQFDSNKAVLVVAVNGVLMVLVAKRLKKKPDCCS
jgi:hypothetical protein